MTKATSLITRGYKFQNVVKLAIVRKKIMFPAQATGLISSEIKPDDLEQVLCKNFREFEIGFIHGFEGSEAILNHHV